jgi:maltokinase
MDWLRAAPGGSLAPPRRAGTPDPAAGARPLDVLLLGPSVCLAVSSHEAGYLVVPIRDDEDAPRRAVPGDGVSAAILHLMRGGVPVGAFAGSWAGPDVPGPGDDETAIDVDQSNESTVVGGTAVVKLYPFTAPGPQPGLDLPAHLASVGFTELPAPLGALRWTSPGGDDIVIATSATYLPGARDGWDWYLERLLALLDGEADPEDPSTGSPAAALGAIAARMHAALATPSPVIPDPTHVADAATADRWRRSALEVAAEAMAVTDADDEDPLAVRADGIRAELDRLGGFAGATTCRVHGDFHVGQVLEWHGGFAITDFDGVPTAPPEARGRLDTPVRDVAAFVRSIDHLGRIASRRRPGHDERIESWIASSRASFLGSYVAELEASGHGYLFDERLLRPLEVAQECHEYVYAARYLPRWRYVPDLAMRALMPVAGS